MSNVCLGLLVGHQMHSQRDQKRENREVQGIFIIDTSSGGPFSLEKLITCRIFRLPSYQRIPGSAFQDRVVASTPSLQSFRFRHTLH